MKPNYEKWKRKDLWTIFQASCVVAGAEPPVEPIPKKAFKEIRDKEVGRLASEIYEHAKDAIDLGKLKQAARSRTKAIKDKLVKPSDFVSWLSERGGYEIPEALRELAASSSTETSSALAGNHISKKLRTLNLAARKFWENADRDDPDTQPENAKVIAWLCQKGFPKSLAEKGATILRPDWAFIGRKPEK